MRTIPCFISLIVLFELGCGEVGEPAPVDIASTTSARTSAPVPMPQATDSVSPPSPTVHDLPAGVVLHLSFDLSTACKKENRIYIKDLSGRGNDAALRKVTPAKGKFGTAIDFHGDSGSKVTGSDQSLPSGQSPMTISLWFNARKHDLQHLFMYGTAERGLARGIAVVRPPGMTFFHWGGRALHLDSVYYSLNRWHHFVATYENGKAAIYLDGELKGEGPFSANTMLLQYIIGKAYSEGGHFDGMIDEVIVFDRALPPAEIKVLYERPEYMEQGELAYTAANPCE